MKDQEPYLDLDPDYEYEQIVERFKTGLFAKIKYILRNLILYKW